MKPKHHQAAGEKGSAAGAGFVDTHIHIVPGVDDGAETMEIALEMAEVAIADGIRQMVVTPHANYQFRYDRKIIESRLAELQACVGDRLRLMVGCEVHLSYENVQALRDNARSFSLNGGRYVLVEFPDFFDRNAFGPVLEELLSVGLVPVIAHPERNPVLHQHPELLLQLVKSGCLTQITASSFTGRFGKTAQQMSLELLDKNMAHIVASDAHSPQHRSPKISGAHQVISEKQGADVADALCSANPLAIALDKDVPYHPEPAKKKSLWALFR